MLHQSNQNENANKSKQTIKPLLCTYTNLTRSFETLISFQHTEKGKIVRRCNTILVNAKKKLRDTKAKQSKAKLKTNDSSVKIHVMNMRFSQRLFGP